MVMKTSDPSSSKASEKQDDASQSRSCKSQVSNQAEGASRKRLREKVTYEDLENPPAKKKSSLSLAKVERYLNGPTPARSADYLTYEDIAKVIS